MSKADGRGTEAGSGGAAGGGAAARRPGEADRMSRQLVALSTAIRLRVREGLSARGHRLSPSCAQVVPNLPIGGLGLSELAAKLRLTLQRTGQLVQQLESDGYVERVPDARDGRAKRVVYSARGLELVRDIDAIMGDLRARFEGVLGAERFARLCADLAELDAAVNGEDAPLRVLGGA